MRSTPASERVLVGTTSTITCQWVDQNGEPAAAASNPTVIVQTSQGATVDSGDSTTGVGTGVYTFNVFARSELDRLVATWTVGADVRATAVDVVGGVYFTIAQARAADQSLENTEKYPASQLLSVRATVEAAIEDAAGVAFVPRFSIVEASGTGAAQAMLPTPLLRAVRWATELRGDGTEAALTVSQSSETGLVAFSRVVPTSSRVRCGVEHGHDRPPGEIVDAAITVLRSKASAGRSAIPSRAERIQTSEGGTTFLLSMPGKRKFGMPEVDAAIARHSWDLPGIA